MGFETIDRDRPWITPNFYDLLEHKGELFDFLNYWYTTDETAPQTKDNFETMFVKRYFKTPIKAEEFTLFKIRLDDYLFSHMEHWKHLYETIQIEYDPLINVDLHSKTHDKEDTDNTTDIKGSSENSGTSNMTTNTSVEGNYNTLTNSSGSSNETVDSTLTTTRTENTQGINSDNPQINFAGNDYAATMQRGMTSGNGTDTGHQVTDSGTNTETNVKGDSSSETESVSEGSTGSTGTTTGKNVFDGSVDRNVDYTNMGFTGSSKTDNIMKYRDAIINLNLRIVEGADYLFSNYLGRGVTLNG